MGNFDFALVQRRSKYHRLTGSKSPQKVLRFRLSIQPPSGELNSPERHFIHRAEANSIPDQYVRGRLQPEVFLLSPSPGTLEQKHSQTYLLTLSGTQIIMVAPK